MTKVADEAIASAQAAIQQLDGALQGTETTLQERQSELARHGLTPDLAARYLETVPPEHREVRRKLVEETQDEIRRDLPQETATRKLRIKPNRQMV